MSGGFCRFRIPTKIIIKKNINKNNNNNNNNKKKTLRPKMVKAKNYSSSVIVNKPKKGPIISSNSLTNQNRFASQLAQPFDPSAMGCRVPDPFSFPTATYHLHGNVVLASDVNGCGGLLFMPSPLLSMVDTSKASGGSSIVTSSSFVDIGAAGTSGLTYGATNSTGLGVVLATQRVVSWGIKITNLQPELSATGRIYVALYPACSNIPGEEMLNNAASPINATYITSYCINQVPTAVYNSAIENQPSGAQFGVQDLLHGDLQVVGSYTDPTYFKFKDVATMNNYSSTFVYGTEALSGGGTISNVGNSDVHNMTGGVAICVYYEGMPASTTKVLDIEYIYHLEGSVAGASSKTSPVPSNQVASCVGTTVDIEKAMSAAGRNFGLSWIDKGLAFVNNGIQKAQTFSKSPLGQFARMALGV